MVNKIEQLRLEVDEIKNLLNELKNNVSISEVEKKNQAEMIKNRAEGTKQKIQNEINLLEGKTDDESMKKKDEAETLLKSFTDITNLYNSIINSENTTSSEKQPETNGKNIFWKAWDWIKEQWSDIWDKEKWKTEWWKNILRSTWFIWAVALSYKWIKKLFWWWEDEEYEENEEDDEKKEKEDKKEKEEKSSIRKRIGSLVLDYFERNKK